MGVYQSVTEPRITSLGCTRLIHRDQIESFGGVDAVTKYLQKIERIPRKVKPVVTYEGSTVRLSFRWYGVETFN